MWTCESCGRTLLNTQEVCDCAVPTARPSRLGRPWPLFTILSVLTAAAVEGLILLIAVSLRGVGLAGGAALFGGPVVLIGVLLNGVAGYAASQRGECWGGDVATIGIGVWAVTIVV